MSYFHSMDEMGRKELVPGVHLRTVWGDKVMLSLVDIAATAKCRSIPTRTSRPA